MQRMASTTAEKRRKAYHLANVNMPSCPSPVHSARKYCRLATSGILADTPLFHCRTAAVWKSPCKSKGAVRVTQLLSAFAAIPPHLAHAFSLVKVSRLAGHPGQALGRRTRPLGSASVQVQVGRRGAARGPGEDLEACS